MDPKRFENSTTGHVVRVGQGATAYWAFVPETLPFDVVWTHDLVRSLSRADQALGRLAGLGHSLHNPYLLIRPFVRREAVLSSQIEGTQADITDLYAYEAGQSLTPSGRTSASDADVREVSNYVRALEYGLERVQEVGIGISLLRELHELLLQNHVRGELATPGEFRRSQNWVGRPGCTLNEADFVSAPPAFVRTCLDQLMTYLAQDDDLPDLVRLALIHYQFEAIHPFLDGNGRIGRLLISLLTVHWGLLPLPLLYLSAYFNRHRQTYYDLLLGMSTDGAVRPWICFFLDGVADQAADAVNRATRLQLLRDTWRAQMTEARASSLLLRLVDSLFEWPILTIPQAAATLDVTYPSARSNVQRLVDAGILHPASDATYGRTYAAVAILELIGEVKE